MDPVYPRLFVVLLVIRRCSPRANEKANTMQGTTFTSEYFGIITPGLEGMAGHYPYGLLHEKWFILIPQVQLGGSSQPLPSYASSLRPGTVAVAFVSFNPGPYSCSPDVLLPSPSGSGVKNTSAGDSLLMEAAVLCLMSLAYLHWVLILITSHHMYGSITVNIYYQQ